MLVSFSDIKTPEIHLQALTSEGPNSQKNTPLVGYVVDIHMFTFTVPPTSQVPPLEVVVLLLSSF